MTPETPPEAKPRRLWLRILFGLSLALNLLVIGLAIGAWWRLDGGRGKAGPASLGAAIYHELPREERLALRRQAREGREAPRRARRGELMELVGLLRADPFVEADVIDLLSRERARRDAQMEAIRGAWLAHVTAMQSQDRAAYADRLEERINRRGRKEKTRN